MEMKLEMKFKLHNVFKPKASTKADKDGVIKPAKWQLQYLNEIEGEDGVQLNIGKVSLPLEISDEQLKKYQDSIGKEVVVPVKEFVNEKRQIVHYGV